MSHADPYSDFPAGQAPAAAPAAPASVEMNDAPRGRSRSRSPARNGAGGGGGSYRSPRDRSAGGAGGYRKRSPAPRKPNHAPSQNPTPSNVLGVFGLSIRTAERDLEDEFSRFGSVTKVTIVYDQRTDRSRGFGFIVMGTVEDAARCVQELNGVELNGRRIRVDYSVTERPHQPTPGEYMGLRRSDYSGRRDDHRGGSSSGGRRDDRPRYDRDDRDHRRDDHRDRDYRRGGDDRDYRRGDDRDYRDRRSPPARGGGGGGGGGYSRYSPRRRSFSPRSPAPRAASPAAARHADTTDAPRW